MKVSRVDHGVRCMEDPALVARLVRDRVPLTVCPLSNVRLRVVDKLSDHPLRRMLDAGLVATCNSDDPAYFGGYVGDNFRESAAALSLTDARAHRTRAQLVRSLVHRRATRSRYIAEIDSFVTRADDRVTRTLS